MYILYMRRKERYIAVPAEGLLKNANEERLEQRHWRLGDMDRGYSLNGHGWLKPARSANALRG